MVMLSSWAPAGAPISSDEASPTQNKNRVIGIPLCWSRTQALKNVDASVVFSVWNNSNLTLLASDIAIIQAWSSAGGVGSWGSKGHSPGPADCPLKYQERPMSPVPIIEANG